MTDDDGSDEQDLVKGLGRGAETKTLHCASSHSTYTMFKKEMSKV